MRLTKEAFRVTNDAVRIHVAADGNQAMAFLRRQGTTAMRCAADSILLDLNLPKMDGREVLAQIKQDDRLKLIPTVILTTSEAEADVVRSLQLHANCFLTDPYSWKTSRRSSKASTTSG